MTQAQQIEIVTIYNAAQTTGARTRLRALALISLAVAGVWLSVLHFEVDPWIGKVFVAAIFGDAVSALPDAPDQTKKLTPQQRLQRQADAKANAERTMRRGVIRTVEMYVWLGIAYLAGGWLALAGLVGVLGRRVSLRMQRQAALLMILSTIASIAGIWVAIKWGGMPPHADLELYAKIGAVQSSYAWFLLVATRLVR